MFYNILLSIYKKMEPNFYENLIASKDKEKLELIKKQSKLLDESLDKFISVRKTIFEENFVDNKGNRVNKINFSDLLSRRIRDRYIATFNNTNSRRRRDSDSNSHNNFLDFID